MKVHIYEKAVLTVGAGLLIGCLGALAFATWRYEIHLPGHAASIDPQRAAQTPPFNAPGVREVGPGRYEVVVLGQAWSFNPPEIRIPAGSEVTFIATTTDVLHGFHIDGTRVNVMLIPGQVSQVTHTFEEAGEHLLVCHEYCGAGHHFMHGRVIVE